MRTASMVLFRDLRVSDLLVSAATVLQQGFSRGSLTMGDYSAVISQPLVAKLPVGGGHPQHLVVWATLNRPKLSNTYTQE